ncbi:hypothetical protein VTK73DRAFT_3736 [Phialemonium thermophilum]|uniref:HAM1-like N-terminal domain-containing protein n=1 Tax=Phialemonium thermophilum TaxID=223376 RepID=A0ABR3XZK1_9PEZI
MLSSCFGRSKPHDEEREPLLPQYHHDTALQEQLQQKLHTYQMLRAMGQGFMPSNEQILVNLRTLLASRLLNPDDEDLSDSGQALALFSKRWLQQLIQLLQHKNNEDQIQDFLWNLSKARLSLDINRVSQRSARAKAKADASAVYKSLRTVGSLLLMNSDFRLFLSDLHILAREVFKETAYTLADVARDTGDRLEPSKAERESLKHPGRDADFPVSKLDLEHQAAEVSDVVTESASKVAQAAKESIKDKADGQEKDTLLARLRQAVLKLHNRPDYNDSVSTLSLLLKRYALAYSHVVEEATRAAEEEVDWNSEADQAVAKFWKFIRSFGEAKEWDELEHRFRQVVDHSRSDPQFDKFVRQLGNAIQDMLTDPTFFDEAEKRFQELREKSHQLTSDSLVKEDIDGFLAQLQSTFRSVLRDQDVSRLLETSSRIVRILLPTNDRNTNEELYTDCIRVFVPLAIQAIQYVPVPRLEISNPEVDLLLENLILEPGNTVNNSSFLPYKLRIETYNDLEIRKARLRTTSAAQSLVRVKIDGISVRAEDVGYWFRLHSGIFRFVDEGIASFQLDERGIDIHLDIEIGKDRLENLLALRSVRVHIHKLNYKLRKSKFACFAWLLKPLLRPLIRKTMEVQIASAIADAIHATNRELLFARERLRATRISDPDDLRVFFKAVAARLVPPGDPDSYVRVGVTQPGYGVFEGRYAPGSIVKVWNEEAARAPQRIRENERDGWRNSIFDVHVRPAA